MSSKSSTQLDEAVIPSTNALEGLITAREVDREKMTTPCIFTALGR